MKRLIACASLVAAATTAAPAANPPAKPAAAPAKTAAKPPGKPPAKKAVAKAPKCRVAPADEYFGKLKLSILGIRNTIKDQGLKADFDPANAPTMVGSVALTEDAIHDWEHKYPCDGWLPGTVYALEHFYAKIHTNDGVKHVHATFAWLRHDFPRSSFVAVALRENGSATAVAPPPAAPAAASDVVVPTGAGVVPAPFTGPATGSEAAAVGSPSSSGAVPAPARLPPPGAATPARTTTSAGPAVPMPGPSSAPGARTSPAPFAPH